MDATRLFDLTGKNALVTGASRGIGQALAEALSAAGADVAVTARDENSLRETADRIGAHGRSSLCRSLDVLDTDRIRVVVDEAADAFGGLDILVNNAGYEKVQPSLDVDEAVWDSIVSTNLKGAFFCAQAAARRMAADKSGGAIINLCSLTSYVGIPTAVPYGSSKS
ncbi:MAG: SDR family oxidoreductase, partial [Mesorhizobium sp.]